MNADLLSLHSDDPNAGAILNDAVSAALSRRGTVPALAIDLDGEHLSPAFVAALVRELRRMRDVGGSIVVDVRNQVLRDAIRVHGLDRIFGTSSAARRPQATVHAAPIVTPLARPATAQ